MPKAKRTLLDTLTKGFEKNFGERVKEQVEMEAASKKKGGVKKKGDQNSESFEDSLFIPVTVHYPV